MRPHETPAPTDWVQGSLSSNLPSSPSEAHAARVCLREAPSRRPLSGPVCHGLGSSWASLAQRLQWPWFRSVERPPGHTGHMREFTRERLGPPPLRPTWGLRLSGGLCSWGSSRVCCLPRGCREALGAPGAEPWQRRGPGMPALCAQYVALSQAEKGSSWAGSLVTKGPMPFTWAVGSQQRGCRWGAADADLPGPLGRRGLVLPSPHPLLARGCHRVRGGAEAVPPRLACALPTLTPCVPCPAQMVNASRSIEDVHREIRALSEDAIQAAAHRPLGQLWT